MAVVWCGDFRDGLPWPSCGVVTSRRPGKAVLRDFAVFSPDGTNLLFSFDKTSPGQGDLEVYRIALADRKLLPLATTQGALSHEESPCWSPDGRRIAFTSNRDGNLEIYTQSIDGPAINVSRHEAIDNFPAWTPDGRIGFVSNRDGGFDLYSIAVPQSAQ